MPPDSGKEPIGHLISAAVRGPSTLGRSEKLATRTEGISKQCSDGEEEEEDVLSHSQSVSESGSEMLGLHPAEPLYPAGLESNIAFVIGPNLPCGYDVEHFSLSDLVKYIQPYCDASGVLCLGTDTDSAGSVIEVQVIQDDDLQLPMVLGEDGEYRMEAIGVNGKVLVAGEESVMTKVSDPENLPQASKPEEAFLGPLVHQGDPPVTLRRRGRPRKTAKRAETLVSGAPRDISERPGAHCGLQTRLQRAADKRRASREAPSPQAGGKQEPAALTLQEFTLLADQMEEVELGEQRMQIRGRAAARRQRAAGRGPKKLPSPEIRAAGRDCSFANAEGWSMEPHLWSADIPAKPATGREESPGNILATTFPMADPALPFPIADPAPRSPMADPAPTAGPALTASPATTSPMTDPALTFPIADPAPRSRAASPATTSQMTDPALTSRAANPVPRSPMADPAPTSPMTDLAPRFPTTDPAPTFPTTDPVLTASPATTFPTTDPAPMTDP
ncbi:hypothetical protein scyTo_0025557, partial [Scyliorhinus torazame]|nr:hypothetical protein [Scyliorhinus torazame]